MKKILITILFSVFIVGQVISQEIIEMKKDESGVYTIPCEVNGLKLRFIFDTGASVVSISLTEASFMLKNGYLNDSDITGTTNVQTADGEIAENYVINLKELKIGSVTLNNVKAVVSSGLDAPLLLGQSVLDKLGYWSFKDSSLILNDYSCENNGDNGYTWEQIEQMLRSDEKNFALKELSLLVEGNDDYAAYLYLSNVENPKDASKELINNPIIVKAMSILEESKSNDVDDIYWNYEKLIWFCLYRLNDGVKALQYFRRVEAKDILSITDLDKLAYNIVLANGWGMSYHIDEVLVTEFLNKGYYKAYNLYANYLKDIKNSPTEAYRAYKLCSDKGYTPASIKLGLCLINGEGVVKNSIIGFDLLDKAATKGYIEAITELCSRYYYGDGVNQDYDKVLAYARLFGHDGACDLLYKGYTGMAYFAKKDYRFALQELNELDLIWESKPSEITIAAFNSGLNRINTEILSAVGQAYEKGLGCKLDFEKAFKCYTTLSEKDPAWGYGMLGDMFFLNELIESDAERAYQYYVLGANNGSGYCCFRLALMNYYGAGTLKNEIKAIEYKAKAIKLGFKETDFNF